MNRLIYIRSDSNYRMRETDLVSGLTVLASHKNLCIISSCCHLCHTIAYSTNSPYISYTPADNNLKSNERAALIRKERILGRAYPALGEERAGSGLGSWALLFRFDIFPIDR